MKRRTLLKRTGLATVAGGAASLAGCTPATTPSPGGTPGSTPGGTPTRLNPTPVAGKLVLANNSNRTICSVLVAPFTRTARQQDLLVLANTPNQVNPGDVFVIAAADYAALDEGTPYSLRVESCSGGLSERITDSFSFERGSAVTINAWTTPTP